MAKATHDEKERVLATKTTYGCAGSLPYLDKRQAQLYSQGVDLDKVVVLDNSHLANR